MLGGAEQRWSRTTALPSFSKPPLGQEASKSDGSKVQKLTAAEFFAAGGGILAGCAIIFTVIGLDSLTQGTRHTAVPTSCHDPPLECWDAFSKANGGIMCPVMYQDTYIRGELVKAGERTCYKAVYWNIDKATMVILAWFITWVALVLKALERSVKKAVTKSCRWPAFAAIFTAQPSLWYSFILMIHYHNDFWFNFYSSQLFFTITESFVFVTMTILLDKKKLIPAPLWYAAAGTSAYHIFQMLLDEGANIVRGIRLGRAVHMLLGDITSSAVLWMLGRSCHNEPKLTKVALRVALVVLLEWLTFNLVFGDAASSGFSQRIHMGRAQQAGVHHDVRIAGL